VVRVVLADPLASTHSNIYVYAHNAVTNVESQAVRGFNITDKK